SFVLNDKKWVIASDGEIDLEKNFIHIAGLRLSSTNEQISISTPTDNNIQARLDKVTIEDLLPMVLKDPRMEGQMSGVITLQDVFGKMGVVANTTIDQFRFETDSLGRITAGINYNPDGDVDFKAESENPHYNFTVEGGLSLKDSTNRQINASVHLDKTSMHLL